MDSGNRHSGAIPVLLSINKVPCLDYSLYCTLIDVLSIISKTAVIKKTEMNTTLLLTGLSPVGKNS